MDNNSMAIRKLKFHMAGRNPQIVPCLVGPTGIGKTAIVKQVAKELGAELVYFNMAQQNQGDNALPVPHINAGQTLVQYALHHKFQEILDNPNKDYLVMCDELARAQIPVLSEWMTVLNERQIQGQKFGNNVRFVAAMNPSSTMKGYEDTDYIATEMDPAHLTRFHFIYMKEDRLDWLKWAKENNIHEYVIRFLEDAKNIAYFYGQSVDDVRVRTPKGWEQLSDMLKDMEAQGLFDNPSNDDRAFIAGVISDQIGYDAGPLFATMIWDAIESIPLSKVMTNKPVPQKLINQFANNTLQKQIITVDSWLAEMKERNVKFTPQHVANFIAFWETMKSDDAKTNVGYAITRDFFVADLNASNAAHVKDDCIAGLFYFGDETYNKSFVEFMNKALSAAEIKVS
jgi:ATPase